MRKVMDCRQYPSESHCSLTIAGEEEEVMRAAVLHSVDVHGHQDTPEFRATLQTLMKDEAPQHA
ncbi:DUF1059 domain-containing protein [Streptomyces sp. NBC_00503]|uniref:DUF1059 domain-containing protein n=1 Tax=Streptomyces sp. NBC_00503 TaxID=2903659 RepID=UPI002E80F650|nr:DUF1059 domain-containing protein [Streptomyces sp. NBC_00503]WUD80249.1 DUF1059 domain-containing protein [Streptomyces sp. NBC_00503]